MYSWKCDKCGSDLANITIDKRFQEDDGQIEYFEIECKKCKHKVRKYSYGFNLSNELLSKLLK